MADVNACIGNFALDGQVEARHWSNPQANFDNVGAAMLALTETASLELWLENMYRAMDAPTEIGKQPTENNSWPSVFYFVVFVIIGSFLVVNLFVGAVVNTFSKVPMRVPAVALCECAITGARGCTADVCDER